MTWIASFLMQSDQLHEQKPISNMKGVHLPFIYLLICTFHLGRQCAMVSSVSSSLSQAPGSSSSPSCWPYITPPSGKAKARFANAHVGKLMTWSEIVEGVATMISMVSGAKPVHSQCTRVSVDQQTPCRVCFLGLKGKP